MRYKGDWLIDPDGRMTEDRKDGPVTTYKLSPEELKKYQGGKVMTEVNIELDGNKIAKAIMPEVENEKKRMTKKMVMEMHKKGMVDDEIAEYFGCIDGRAKVLAKARIAKYLKPKEEPVEITHTEEPVEVIGTKEEAYDFWEGVRVELMGIRESEFDRAYEELLKALNDLIAGDQSEETLAKVWHYAEQVLRR